MKKNNFIWKLWLYVCKYTLLIVGPKITHYITVAILHVTFLQCNYSIRQIRNKIFEIARNCNI